MLLSVCVRTRGRFVQQRGKRRVDQRGNDGDEKRIRWRWERPFSELLSPRMQVSEGVDNDEPQPELVALKGRPLGMSRAHHEPVVSSRQPQS